MEKTHKGGKLDSLENLPISLSWKEEIKGDLIRASPLAFMYAFPLVVYFSSYQEPL